MTSYLTALHSARIFAFAVALWAPAARGQTPKSDQPRTANVAADARAVREARIAQNRAIAAGDIDRVAAFWTDDVEIRRGLGQLVLGPAAYRALFVPTGNRDSAFVYQREPTSIEVSPRWPLAYESGTWAAHIGRTNGPVVIRGRYSAQWVKRADHWLIRGEVYVALTCAGVGCSSAAAP